MLNFSVVDDEAECSSVEYFHRMNQQISLDLNSRWTKSIKVSGDRNLLTNASAKHHCQAVDSINDSLDPYRDFVLLIPRRKKSRKVNVLSMLVQNYHDLCFLHEEIILFLEILPTSLIQFLLLEMETHPFYLRTKINRTNIILWILRSSGIVLPKASSTKLKNENKFWSVFIKKNHLPLHNVYSRQWIRWSSRFYIKKNWMIKLKIIQELPNLNEKSWSSSSYFDFKSVSR